MNYRSIVLASFMGLLLTTGCSHFGHYNYNQPVQQDMPVTQSTCPKGQYPSSGATGCTPGDDFVNYTKVASDYRQYGERTPRDHMIVQTGVGSNLSSTIPPTIEGEVIEYEEIIEESDADSSSNDGSNADVSEEPVEDWLAEEGQSLKALLTEWADRAGWRLVWKTNRNYTLTAGAMFRGRFADVTSALIRAFARAKPAPIATFYKGNRVLVIETMEDENAYE